MSPTMMAAWALALAMGLMDLAWMLGAGVGLALRTALIRLGAMLGLIGLKWYYDRRGEAQIATLLHVIAYLIFFSAAAAFLSYLSASFWTTLRDPELVRADALLGLDWLSYQRLVDRVPHLAQVFTVVYFSSLPQIIVMLIWLCWLRRIERAEGLGFDLAFGCVACIIGSGLVPALGAYAYLDPAHISLAIHVDDAQAMRSGTLKRIDLGTVQGLVTFPSFHMVISLALIWASRGIRILFPIVLVLNLAIIAATPIVGGHYFVDLLGGALVALVTIAARSHFLRVGDAPHTHPPALNRASAGD